MKKTLKKRRKEFLDETVRYYSADTSRRATAIDSCNNILGSCRYRLFAFEGDPNPKKCALGRHIPDELYNPDVECLSSKDSEFMVLLPKEVSELGAEFLSDIQSLHDVDANWGATSGLTDWGQEEYERILTNIEFSTYYDIL